MDALQRWAGERVRLNLRDSLELRIDLILDGIRTRPPRLAPGPQGAERRRSPLHRASLTTGPTRTGHRATSTTPPGPGTDPLPLVFTPS